MEITSTTLLALSAKWRKEADGLDDEARRETNRIARHAFIGAATRMRRMANELDSANKEISIAPEGVQCQHQQLS
jgi:hypothetical protein